MTALIDVRCPADGRLVGSVSNLEAGAVAATAAALREAQPAWEALGPDGRVNYLLRWLDWFLDHERRLTELVQEETGKSWGDATSELVMVMEVLNYYARRGPGFLAERPRRPHGPAAAGKRLVVRHRPYPLVGIITPWNAPLAVPILDVAAALMAGAAVLSKPSEVTPLAWTEAVRGWREDVGAPLVMASATGAGGTGAAVVDVVDMVMFTGSTRTGRRIAVRAAERLIPCSLELGGKDPMIVLADADLDRAAGAASWGAMMNAGQACVSVERVYVETAVHDEFVAKVLNRVGALRLGMDEPGAFTCDLGAIATDTQLRLIEGQVADAVARGAQALTGGRRTAEGCFFEPTVLVGVDHSMSCMQEETFGPVLPVMSVRDADEAVALANDSDYGLSASVWSRDVERARRIGERLQVGAVNINNVLMHAVQFPLPMGGWKESGIGTRCGGPDGVLKFCRPQAFVSERVHLRSEPHWYPHSARKGRVMARVIRLLEAHDWRRRLTLP